MKLYSYFRSSAAYRVRIALNLKGLAYETVPVHLLKDGGQQLSEGYRQVNPAGLVPALADGDWTIGQSMAILEYLEETHPEPALLPAGAKPRARVRSIAQLIACDIHPLNNLRVLKYLKHELQADDEARDAWYRHWIGQGLAAVESLLAGHPDTGRYCHGDQPTFADLCLVPQVFNARRFGCDLSAVPTVLRIDSACAELDAFRKAAPDNQPDSET
jgi:maleylpyruvate isomerase